MAIGAEPAVEFFESAIVGRFSRPAGDHDGGSSLAGVLCDFDAAFAADQAIGIAGQRRSCAKMIASLRFHDSSPPASIQEAMLKTVAKLFTYCLAMRSRSAASRIASTKLISCGTGSNTSASEACPRPPA